jgi:hypothetical protein
MLQLMSMPAHTEDILRQVEWGLSPAGPFNNTAVGYARGYIQVSPHAAQLLDPFA